MPWTPGASGNPKGRPQKSRALTEILLRAGGRRIVTDEIGKNGKPKTVSHKELLAQMLWEGATTGQIVFPSDPITHNAAILALEGNEWLSLVKFLYNQMDGPPRVTLMDVPEDTAIAINFVKVEGRKPTTPTADEDDSLDA